MNFPGYPLFYPVSGTFHSSDDAGKIFVGGIPADATKENLTDYFSQFGEVSDCIIMVDNVTGRSRGFGFVTFLDFLSVDKVIAYAKHVINGKVVDAKRAVPKGPNQSNILQAMGITSNRADRNPECKVFVGGVAQGTTESDLENHFKQYGKVLEVKIPKDQNTQRARGFSFVLFDNPESVIKATKDSFHRLNGKMVEVKKVQLHSNNKESHFDDTCDDGQLRSSPFVFTSRPGLYPTYAHAYPNFNPLVYYHESPYEHSPTGSASSPASSSVSSSGFGNVPSVGTGLTLNDFAAHMNQVYQGLSDLSFSQQYSSRNRGFPTYHRLPYTVPSSTLPSLYTPPAGPSPPLRYSSDLYGSPLYTPIGAHPGGSVTTFNR